MRIALLTASILLAGGVAAAQGGTSPTERLPDLVQERPRDVTLVRVNGRDRLGFTSAVHNAGAGPLIVLGRRKSRTQRDMGAWQVIVQADGSTRTVRRPAGILRYVRSLDHSHWHYRPFERYSLLNASGIAVARDAKSGFCLGDRYRVPQAGGVGRAVYTGACGLRRPGLLGVRQGISVGWGDDYAGFLEGQSIDVSAVAPGRYRLVHTVNGTGALIESRRDNNTAAVTIELTRRGGVARVRVVADTQGRSVSGG